MSLTSQKEQIETNNRRLCPRGTFRGAVLVFFGLGKWGKSEPSGKLATDSIRADGQVVWTRDVERCAGVQFLDVSEATLRQIRTWLSIEPFFEAGTEGEKVQGDAIETRLTRPPLTLHETSKQGTDEGQLRDTEFTQSSNPKVRWNPGFDEPPVEEPSGIKSPINRAALMSMVRWLAVLAMLGGITTMILSQRVRVAALFESIRERSIGNNTPPRAGERSVVKTPLAFQVEAVDMNNRRRLLTFDNDASAVEAWLSAAASSTPNKAFLANPGAPPAKRTTEEKRRSLSNFKLSRPTVTRPATNASTENSTLVIDSGTASSDAPRAGNPSGEILANMAAQVPAAPHVAVSGQIQQARLISSVSPAYPAFARSMGLQGDITIDALIDATGKVTTMKPLSGPVPLQQAAMDALRQWNYEPARLGDQPVSTHLSVTVKFRLN